MILIAGYSIDGHTIFIDRHLPRSFRWLNGQEQPFD
jgi:hypothetical protein